MAIGTPSQWVTSVSEITPEDIHIRGYPMQDLVGRLPFSAIAFLLVRGQVPTPGEAKMMDVILSSILDYALQKSGTIAARAVVSVNPQMTAGLVPLYLRPERTRFPLKIPGILFSTATPNGKLATSRWKLMLTI